MEHPQISRFFQNETLTKRIPFPGAHLPAYFLLFLAIIFLISDGSLLPSPTSTKVPTILRIILYKKPSPLNFRLMTGIEQPSHKFIFLFEIETLYIVLTKSASLSFFPRRYKLDREAQKDLKLCRPLKNPAPFFIAFRSSFWWRCQM